MAIKICDLSLYRFGTIPTCDGRTNRHVEDSWYSAMHSEQAMLARGKNDDHQKHVDNATAV